MPFEPKKRVAAWATTFCVGLAMTTTASFAEETVPTPVSGEKVFDAKLIADVGGTDRINYSGKLRMLSQRLPAAACNLHAGVAPDQAKKILAATTAEFEKIVNALEHGDESLNVIGPESRRKTLAALEGVKAEWQNVGAAAHLILDEGTNDALNQQLADQNGPLLNAAKLLVSELTGQYSDPAALLQADALRIDIAGRQRMLSQRISKDACMMLSGVNVEASRESLGKAVNMFDVSLNALTNGMPEAGIKGSTHPDVVAGLAVVQGHWDNLQPHFASLNAGEKLDTETRGALFEELNVLLVDMNKVVGMISKISKQEI